MTYAAALTAWSAVNQHRAALCNARRANAEHDHPAARWFLSEAAAARCALALAKERRPSCAP